VIRSRVGIYKYIFQVGSWIPWTAIAGVGSEGRSELGAMSWARAFLRLSGCG
jgi:hypothetical protein